MPRPSRIVYDARWAGDHGIGRFAREVGARLPGTTEMLRGRHPVSLLGLAELEVLSTRSARRGGAVFLTPGYCAPVTWRGPLAMTVHDLIHLEVTEEGSRGKSLYYERVVRPAARRADVVLTVSEFSRDRILDWSGVAPERVVNVGNGVDPAYFVDHGTDGSVGDYLLFVGNHRPHKNLPRLIEALSRMNSPTRLVLTGPSDPDVQALARRFGVGHRVEHAGHVPERDLPELYARAAALVIPSLYEGFGLPALEAMATGIPVIAGDATALAEVVGDSGILVDPYDIDALAAAMDVAIGDQALRERLHAAGPERAAKFSWDQVARRATDALALGP